MATLSRNNRQHSAVPEQNTGPASSPHQARGHSWLNRLSYGLGGLVLVGGLALVLRPSALPVDLGYVEQGPLKVTIDEEGQTRIKERFVLSAPVAGRLQRIPWQPGDPVEAGTRLAQIDPLPFETSIQALQAELQEWQAQRQGVETLRPKAEAIAMAQAQISAAQNRVDATQAEVERAAAALEQAQRRRQRAQELETEGALSREERERAELAETARSKEWQVAQKQWQSAQAQLEMARAESRLLEAERADPDYLLQVYGARITALEAELIRLQDEISRTEIYAPVSGQILTLWQESSQVVEAGTPLLEMGDPRDLELVVDVLSQEAVEITAGDPVWVEWEPGVMELVARVSRVEPAAFTQVSALGVEEQRVNVIAEFLNPEVPPLSWGHGYRVDVRIGIWAAEDVLKVPTSALFRCRGNWCVFTVESGIARQTEIQIGRRNDQEAVVLKGLVAGDQVILYPSGQVRAGLRVSGGDRK